MKQYTIKKAVKRINAHNIGTLTKLYIYYELSAWSFTELLDFTDNVINLLYNYYMASKKFNTVIDFCETVALYFANNEINAETITPAELETILKTIY